MEYVHYTFEFVALVMGLLLAADCFRHKKTTSVLLIVAVVVLGSITDLVCWFLIEGKHQTWNVQVVYSLLELVIVLLFFQFVIAGKRPHSAGSNLIFLNVVLIAVWFILNFGIGQPFGQYANAIAGSFGGTLVIVGYWAFHALQQNTSIRNRRSQPEFWVVVGLIIYHIATAVLFASIPFFQQESWEQVTIVWGILQGTTSVFKHSCFIYAFMLCRNNLHSK